MADFNIWVMQAEKRNSASKMTNAPTLATGRLPTPPPDNNQPIEVKMIMVIQSNTVSPPLSPEKATTANGLVSQSTQAIKLSRRIIPCIPLSYLKGHQPGSSAGIPGPKTASKTKSDDTQLVSFIEPSKATHTSSEVPALVIGYSFISPSANSGDPSQTPSKSSTASPSTKNGDSSQGERKSSDASPVQNTLSLSKVTTIYECEPEWTGRPNETWVLTFDQLVEFLPNIQKEKLTKGKLQLFMDMEGDNLCKFGTISLIQITIDNHTWIIDITTLGKKAFHTMGPHGEYLRDILEDPAYPVAFWDCRNDVNALFFNYGIIIRNVVDVQLLELAVRSDGWSRRVRLGLGDAIVPEAQASGLMTRETADEWTRCKNVGKSHFKHSEIGYAEFDVRPLTKMVMKYAGQETQYMPLLYDSYMSRITKPRFTYAEVLEQSALAAKRAMEEDYNPKNRQNFLSPAFFTAHEDPYDDYDDP